MTVSYDSLIKIYRKERLKEIASGPRNKDKENYDKEFNKLAIENNCHDLMYQEGVPHNHPSRMNISTWKENILKPQIDYLSSKEQEKNIDILFNGYIGLLSAQILLFIILWMLGRG